MTHMPLNRLNPLIPAQRFEQNARAGTQFLVNYRVSLASRLRGNDWISGVSS